MHYPHRCDILKCLSLVAITIFHQCHTSQLFCPAYRHEIDLYWLSNWQLRFYPPTAPKRASAVVQLQPKSVCLIIGARIAGLTSRRRPMNTRKQHKIIHFYKSYMWRCFFFNTLCPVCRQNPLDNAIYISSSRIKRYCHRHFVSFAWNVNVHACICGGTVLWHVQGIPFICSRAFQLEISLFWLLILAMYSPVGLRCKTGCDLGVSI